MDSKLQQQLKLFLRDEEGATAIEYALIGALISVAIIGGVSALGSANNTMYENLRTTLTGAGIG